MTLFEYLAIAFSLVFSFTAVRLLAGLSSATRAGRRYWIHLTFTGVNLALTIIVFWWFWSFRDIDWSLPGFVLVLANPGLIFFCACVLIPENASSVDSWHDHYYSVRRRYFVGVVCWTAVAASSTTVLLELPLLHFARAGEAGALLVGLVGAVSGSERVHAGLALCCMAVMPVFSFTLFARPDFLAP